MMKRLVSVAALAAVLLCAAGQARAANLLTNGDFETGDLSGWTTSNLNASFVTSSGFDGYPAQSGNYFFAMGNVGSLGSISQTVSDTSGQSYTVSMYLAGNGTSPSEFQVQWNGTTLTDINPVPSTGGYELLTFTVTGTGSDTLTISELNNPSYDALDNVSVSPAATPEPASLTLLGLGALGLAGYGWRRRKAAASV